MKSVLLIGCGNIGFRHLQALCAMPIPAEIDVVEPDRDLHDRISTQFADAASSPHRFTLLERLPERRRVVDLCVVATTASVRRAVVDDVLDRHDVGSLILEKILFQRVGDLDAVGELLAERAVKAFVNCGRRTFPGYQALRDQLTGARPLEISVHGHQIGLASNAIHFLDLAEYLGGSPITELDASGLEPGAAEGRRPGHIELYGTLVGHLDNGTRVSVESRDVSPVRIEVVIEAGGDRFVIDELARTIDAPGVERGPFGSQNVSETPEIYHDLLETGTCALTPYVDSSRQHRRFLTAVRRHLGLSNDEDVPCPVS